MGSLNLDFTNIWEQASSFVNNMWPVFVVPIGLLLGIGILNFIVKTVRQAITHF